MLSEALQEERQRSEAAVERAVESARQQVQQKMQDIVKVGHETLSQEPKLNYRVLKS